jgi:hypothetical protein
MSATATALLVDPTNDLILSMASVWEIAIKVGLKKLTVLAVTFDDCVACRKSSRKPTLFRGGMTAFGLDPIDATRYTPRRPFGDRSLATRGRRLAGESPSRRKTMKEQGAPGCENQASPDPWEYRRETILSDRRAGHARTRSSSDGRTLRETL